MNIIQMLNKFRTNAVKEVEIELFEENSEKSHNKALYGDFAKTPEFKCYIEAIKNVNKISLSSERLIQGSHASFVGLLIICLISLFISLSLAFIIHRWFFIMTILVLIILLLIIKIWQNVGAVHTETIKCLNSLNTKLSNEKEKFEKNQ